MLKFCRRSYSLALLYPSGQTMSNRMMPGGGNSQAMAPRHPGAPNGMCKYAMLFPESKCCFSATMSLKYGVVVTLHYFLRLQTRPHSLKGQHQRSQVLQRPVIAEGTGEAARRMHTHTHAHAQHSRLNHNVKM